MIKISQLDIVNQLTFPDTILPGTLEKLLLPLLKEKFIFSLEEVNKEWYNKVYLMAYENGYQIISDFHDKNNKGHLIGFPNDLYQMKDFRINRIGKIIPPIEPPTWFKKLFSWKPEYGTLNDASSQSNTLISINLSPLKVKSNEQYGQVKDFWIHNYRLPYPYQDPSSTNLHVQALTDTINMLGSEEVHFLTLTVDQEIDSESQENLKEFFDFFPSFSSSSSEEDSSFSSFSPSEEYLIEDEEESPSEEDEEKDEEESPSEDEDEEKDEEESPSEDEDEENEKESPSEEDEEKDEEESPSEDEEEENEKESPSEEGGRRRLSRIFYTPYEKSVYSELGRFRTDLKINIC